MATIIWQGLRSITQQVAAWTCNASSGAVYSLTHNAKAISYTAGGSDTATTVAAGLAAAWTASREPEWTELTVTASGAVVTVTGPFDGAPMTVTAAATGSGTMTAGTTVAATSPYDLGDAANYTGGSLPTNSDTVVFPAGSADVKYRLNALQALTGLVIRRDEGGPKIGLADRPQAFYVQYRPTRLRVAATTVQLDLGQQDGEQAIRIDLISTNAAVKVRGTNGRSDVATNGQVDVIASGATSTFQVLGASVDLGYGGSTAAAATITATEATIRIGTLTGSPAIEYNDVTSRIASNFTSLLVDGTASSIEVIGTATGALTINGGSVFWSGSGTLASPVVGPDTLLDLSDGTDAVAVTGRISLHQGAVLRDPGTRLTVTYGIDCVRSDATGLDVGKHRRITVDAIP